MQAKTSTSRLMGCLVLLAALSLSYGPAHADKILSRHARAMMIDMRGFPDTEPFVCRGAGFQRNTTDCTQFFRCVDFNNNGKHTIFRFMCGPMAVFDESRSLCTGPELSVPPCPPDQLAAFFVSMKPMDNGTAAASTSRPPSSTTPGFQVTRPTTTPTTTTTTTTTTTSTTTPATTTTPTTITTPTTTATTPTTTTTTATTTTQAPTTPAPTPTPEVVTVVSTLAPVPSTTPEVTTTSSTVASVTIPSTTPEIVTTTSSTVASVTIPSTTPEVVTTTSTAAPTLAPIITPSTTPTPITTTTQATIVEDIKGFITIVDKQETQQVTTVVTIPSTTIWGVVSQGEGSRITIREDPTDQTTFSFIPPGSLLMINVTRPGGVWNNVVNSLFTTSSTTASFPPGTTFSIIKVGPTGQIVSTQTLLTSTTTTQLTVPTNSFFGQIQTFNNKVVTIGGWTFTTMYIITGSTTSSFGVLQPSTTTTTVSSSQTTISTTSTIITGDQQFISGIVTVGAPAEPSQPGQDLIVPGGDLLAVIPQGGQGIVTLIEEGSTTSTDFTITPGSFLGVLAPSNGVGTVTNILQPMFTSSTSTINFPAGSTVSVLKIGTDGKIIRVSFVQITNSFTLFTTIYSVVGIVQTNTFGVISNIGTGTFSTQLLAGAPTPVVFGVVNANPATEITTQVESLSGILQIGDSTFLNPQATATNVQTIPILPGTTSALIVSGEIKITEEDGTSVKQTAVSIPSGGILGIVTLTTGGEITSVVNGYFTTTSTQLIFPSGTRFGIVIIRPDGTMNLQNPIDTTVKTTITVPVGSVFGLLTITSQGVVTGIGSARFTTQYLLISDSTAPNTPATLGNYGVIYFSEQFKLTQSTIINSAPILQQLQTISTVLQINVREQFDSIFSLSIPDGSTFVIIPSSGQGIVTVNEGDSPSTFTVLPGQLFALFDVRDARVTDVGDGVFTTSTTTISFGPGTTYGIVKVGLDGQIIRTEFSQTSQTVITITVIRGSTVGVVQQSTNNVITSIGGSPFAIKPMNTVNPLIVSQITSFVGVLEVGTFKQTVTSAPVEITTVSSAPVTTSSTEAATTTTVAPVTEPASSPVPVTTTSTPEVVTTPVPTTTTPEVVTTVSTAAPVETTTATTTTPAPEVITTVSTATPAETTTTPTPAPEIVTTVSTAAPETTTTTTTTTPAPVTVPDVTSPAPTTTSEVAPTTSTTTSLPAVTTSTPVVVPESIEGFLTIGEKDVIQNVQQLSSVLNVLPDTTWGVVSQGSGSKIVIREEGQDEKIFTIPAGTVLMVNTTQNGGQWTNVAQGLFTTSSTTSSFPAGTTFSVVKLGTTGQIITWQTLHTTSTTTTTVSVPTGSFIGKVIFSGEKVITIGGWTFTTTYITTGTTTSSFAVLQPSIMTTTSQTIITTTSTTITSDRQFISGIITVGGPVELSESGDDLKIPSDNLLAIIPQGGKGTVKVIEEGSTTSTDFTVSPGTIIGVLAPAKSAGIVTNILKPMFTSESSIITFPAGSTVTQYKVGVDGKLVVVLSTGFKSTFTIVTSWNSIVGLVKTTSSGTLTNIGIASFSTQALSGASTQTFFGVLNLGSFETSQVESLSGVLQIGDATFLSSLETTATQTIVIPADSTSAIVTTGDISVTEDDGTSTTQTTFSIPSGGIFGMITAFGGEVTGIAKGYFTTSQTTITFQSGVTMGIVIIRPDGTMRLQNPIISKVKTTITVPTASVYGLIALSSQNVVTGIGSASFVTQNLLTDDSAGPDGPVILGTYGIMYFSEQFKLPQSVVLSSSQVSRSLLTISAIIQLGVRTQFKSIASLSVQSSSTFAILPVNGEGNISINERGISSSFTVFPGRIFALQNVQGATVTDIGDGFFTTSTTTMTFGPGTTYGIVKISPDGEMIQTEFTRTAEASFTITMSTASIVGVVEVVNGRTIVSIGGALFAIRSLTSGVSSTVSLGKVGILDIEGFLSAPVITTTAPTVPTIPSTTTTEAAKPITTPQPPIAGPFTIDCALNQLHQFPLDCSRFYQCFGEDGDRTVYIFPCAPGLIFDEASSQCLTAGEAVCDDLSSVNDTSSSGEGVGGFFQINCSGDLFRYPLNCNNFYQCFKNEEGQETIFVFSCAAGLVFDDTARNCLLPSETSSCSSSESFFRAPSMVFQLKQKIDATSLITSTRTIVQQRLVTKSSRVTETAFSQPHQTVRGSMKIKMGYNGESNRQTGQRVLTGVEVVKQVKSTVGNTRSRLFDSGSYGARIAPLAKSLFKNTNK